MNIVKRLLAYFLVPYSTKSLQYYNTKGKVHKKFIA